MSASMAAPIFPALTPEPGLRRWLAPVFIGALALTLYLTGNGQTNLWDRDEPRYATCVREMRSRGDWVHPTFNGEPRYQKPILIYWLMRAGFALCGDTPFGARLTSALAGTGTCLVVWALGRRMLGPKAGDLAALLMATSPIMLVESKLATTDATLALCVTGAQACLWVLCKRPSRACAAAFWILAALATLTKGPVGIALIAASGLVSWWCGGPTECWKRLQWRWGLCGFVLLTAPWFIVVGVISRGEFFRVAVGEQLITRLTYGLDEHNAFPGYYPVTMLGLFHPWSALMPPALLGAWTRRKSHPAFGFLVGWVLGPLIVLECVTTKLVHYYLPAIPACALLASWLVVALVREEINLRRIPLGRLGFGLLAGTAIAIAVGLMAGAIVGPPGLRLPCLALAVTVAAGSLSGLYQLHDGATRNGILSLAATWILVLLGFVAWLLPAAEPYHTSRQVAERLAKLSRKHNAPPALHSYQEPSLIYSYGAPVPTIRKWSQLYDLVVRNGTVVTALMPFEMKVFLTRTYLEVEPLEEMTHFNLNKGKNEPLQFVLVRESMLARAARIQQALVK